MRRLIPMVALALCATGVVQPLAAQSKNPPPIVRDSDRDGVPDLRDRCRGTPAGNRVDATGCPVPATPPQQQAAAPAATPPRPAAQPPAAQPQPAAPTVQTQAARPDSAAARGAAPGQPAATPPAGAAPGATPPAAGQPPAGAQPQRQAQPGAQPTLPQVQVPMPVVPPPVTTPAPTPTPAQPAAQPPARPAAAPAAADPLLTAGFAVVPFEGEGEAALLDYVHELIMKFDTVALRLRDVFAQASGAPVAGATGPTFISPRERNRWNECRRFHFDILTYAMATADLRERLADHAAVQRAAESFDEALQAIQATGECDIVVSMIEAPDRFTPWGQSYSNAARSFYQNWYAQLRAAHEAARALNRSLATAGRQVSILPGLPTASPHPVMR